MSAMNVYPGDSVIQDGRIYIHRGTERIVINSIWDVAEKSQDLEEYYAEKAAVERESRAVQMQWERERDDAMAEIVAILSKHPDLISAINKWHEIMGWDCVAASEGQTCCIDNVLEAIEA